VPDRRNPFEGVTDFFSELARMRSSGVHGGDDLGIRVELAGVDPEDVDLRFNHGVLTISGVRPPDEDDADAEFYIRERFYGEFRRVITLPDGTSADDINAQFEDGLAEITVSNGVSPTDSTKISFVDKSDGATSRRVRGSDN
jgi:HSP20 family protein